MVVKVVDANTGEILMSKSINHTRTKVGAVGGTRILGVSAGALFFKSKAMEEVVEEAIIEAAGIIVEQRKSLPPPPAGAGGDIFSLEISNVGFSGYNNIRKLLDGMNDVKIESKSFKNNEAKFALQMGIDAETLAEKIMDGSGLNLEITSFDDKSIEAIVK